MEGERETRETNIAVYRMKVRFFSQLYIATSQQPLYSQISHV